MAEIVRRRSWGGVLPLGRQASISGSSLIQCASVSIALSSFQEGQNARHHKQFRREQALAAAIDVPTHAVGRWRPEILLSRQTFPVRRHPNQFVRLFLWGGVFGPSRAA